MVILISGCVNQTLIRTECDVLPLESGNNQREDCYINLSITEENIDYCYVYKVDKYKCINEFAAFKQDVSVCDRAMSLKSECIEAVAETTKDETFCDLIDSQMGRKSCYADVSLVKDDLLLCIKSNMTNYCFCMIAAATKNESTCTIENKCCSSISVTTLNISMCSNGHCYIDLAISTKNESICEMIGNETAISRSDKYLCYSGVAVATNNISICNQNSYNVEQCMSDVFIETENLTGCEMILNDDTREECYLGIAKSKKDEAMCEMLENKRDICYMIVAVKKADKELCNQAGEWKDTCFNYWIKY